MIYKINNNKICRLRRTYYKKNNKQLSLKDVSDITGVSVFAIWKLECDPNANPKLDVLSKVCAFYNISISDILVTR